MFEPWELNTTIRSRTQLHSTWIYLRCLSQITERRLDLFEDIDKYLFTDNSRRGGISVVNHRHAKTNNPMMPNYNPDDVTSWLLFVDANNLYGNDMTCPLPISGFRSLNEEVISAFDLSKSSATDPTGYILEVDLEYLRELHDWYTPLTNTLRQKC